MTRSARGYSLLFVIATTSVLLFATLLLFQTIASSIDVQRTRYRQHKAFYQCDGLGRALRRLVLDELAADPTADAMSKICANGALGGCTPTPLPPQLTDAGFLPNLEPDMQISSLTVSLAPLPVAITSGPLAGLNGSVANVVVEVRARHRSSGVACKSTQTMTVSTVPYTSFGLFAAHPSYEWRGFSPATPPSSSVIADYAVHGEGNFTVGGYDVKRVSAGGNVTTTSTPRWLLSMVPFTTAPFSPPPTDAFHPNIGRFSPTLSAYTPQDGVDVAGGFVSNNDTMRWIVDPVLQSEASDISAHKLAHKASIRIIDGTWYLNDGTWPGVAIWSDHPVAPSSSPFSPLESTAVAQPSSGADSYSYYRMSGGALVRDPFTPNPPAVVSYGHMTTTSGPWRPVDGSAQGTLFDPNMSRDVYPINIDVAALAFALANGVTGELGERLIHHNVAWNGIIYVTSTWGSSLANRPTLQTIPSSVTTPRPRCGDAAIIPCPGVAPDVVRVVNADNLSAFGRGLTIATNLPVLVQGPVNTAGDIPFLVAGDTVTVLSTNWNDTAPPPTASVPMAPFRMSVITGQGRATGGQRHHGTDGVVRVWEDWTGHRPVLRGAIIVTHFPVYAQHPYQESSPPSTRFPGLIHVWDMALGAPGGAPPGVPVIQQINARSWEQ